MVRLSNSRSKESAGVARRRRRAEWRRLEILRAAAAAFRTRGFAAAGMRDVAAAAEVSPANLYHYFRGKDAILFACQDGSLSRLLASLAAARRRRGSIATQLHTLAAAHVRCLIDEFSGSASYLESAALPRALGRRIASKRGRYERGVRALIERGMRRHELRAGDPTVSMRAFIGALNATPHWFDAKTFPSIDRVVELVADYVVAGLTVGVRKGTAARMD